MKPIALRVALLALLVATAIVLQAPAQSPLRADGSLEWDVKVTLEAHGEGVSAGLWVGTAEGESLWGWREDQPMPVASAIKTAYLIELFAAHAGRLDEPLEGAAAILADDHPAVAHFDAKVREQARKDLGAASVRRIGEAMIRGKGVSNAVYNVAANVVTASFGGPPKLQERILARDPLFAGLHVRRYMLADRTKTGDNEATARGLAAPLQRLARRDLPGVDAETVDAMRSVMRAGEDAVLGIHFSKGGSLDSDPLTRVRSGWYEKDGRAVVYAVLLAQPGPGAKPRAEAGAALEKLAATLQQRLVERAAAALKPPAAAEPASAPAPAPRDGR